MGNAGTQDLRGVEVLPYALKVIGHPSNPDLAEAVTALQCMGRQGAHRISREHPGRNRASTTRPTRFGSWTPGGRCWSRPSSSRSSGASLLGQIESEFPINDEPGHGTSGSHLGSAFDVGFYGIVQKDLRAALGERVRGPLNRVYCGNGSLSAAARRWTSLSQAIAETPQQVYPADSVCAAGDQMCSDSIQFRAIGAITQPLIEWINRPTFQQADDSCHGLQTRVERRWASVRRATVAGRASILVRRTSPPEVHEFPLCPAGFLIE